MNVGGTNSGGGRRVSINGNESQAMSLWSPIDGYSVQLVDNDYGRYNWFYNLPESSPFEETGSRTHTFDDDVAGLSAEQMRVFAMFSSDTPFDAEDADHPLESLYGIDRPLQQFMYENGDTGQDLQLYKKTTWDTYATQLSDAVTQLNQQVQIKQNEIDDASAAKNRHFELGDNALSKMYDMISSIASF